VKVKIYRDEQHEERQVKMDVQEHKSFLLKIANEVEKLLANHANQKRFKQYCKFYEELAEHQKKANEQQAFSSSDKTYPGLKLVLSKFGGIPPQNNKEALEKYYLLLIIIHDYLLEDYVPVCCKPPIGLAGLVGCLDFNLTNEEQTIIETALEHVKADLAEKPAETQISPMDTVIGVLDDCIGRIHDWFECKGIKPEYSIRNARNEAIKIQEKLKGIGTPAGEPDFAKGLEEIRRRLSDYKNEQINRRLLVIEKRAVDVVTFTDYPNASPPYAPLGNMKEELEGLRDDLVCWTGEKNQADLKPAERRENATPATIINIDKIDKLGVLGNVQAEIVQTGDYSSIHEQMITGEKKRGIFIRLLKIIGAIAALLTILHYLGWLEPIKALLLPK
jgi:hypothetical protein